jgi:hypothetical protein
MQGIPAKKGVQGFVSPYSYLIAGVIIKTVVSLKARFFYGKMAKPGKICEMLMVWLHRRDIFWIFLNKAIR